MFFLYEILRESREPVSPGAVFVLLGKVCSRPRCQSLEVLLESSCMELMDMRKSQIKANSLFKILSAFQSLSGEAG